ncbi:MAG: hypothetical protein PSV18_09650 [Methylobacter sp.]|nr:hypothetical protein [Candidatus Methylobacter titanis]
MANIRQIISLSDSAFFTIVTSALEAYSICHQDDSKDDHVPLETYGNLWGYQATTKRKESLLHVVLADSDTSAKCKSGEATPADDTFDLKTDFADSFFPELEYLGDFHSHPYDVNEVKTELELQRGKLFEQSSSDAKFAKYQQGLGKNYQLQIIATVFERHEQVNRASGHIKGDLSCIRFQYDKRTIWIKAYAYRVDEKENIWRKVNKDTIALICPCVGVTVETING